MNSVIKNHTEYETNCSMHNYNNRGKEDLHFDLKLSLVQKGVKYTAIKIFNAHPVTLKVHKK